MIQLVFINNGFHYKFIDKIKDKILSRLNNTDDKEDNEQQYIYYKLPYICLLYTSPSPRDGLLSRMPSSA